MLADLKFAFRQLLKAPGFTAVAVIALALGIATSTTMFTFFNGIILRPLPFIQDEGSLLYLRAVDEKYPSSDMPFSMPDFMDVRAQATTLGGSLTVWDRTYILEQTDRPQRLLGSWITVDGFQTLGVEPLRGRLFTPEDARLDGPRVVILGYETWQTHFGGREDLMGETIRLNQEQVTVVGVMPRGFRFPDYSDLWQPFLPSDKTEEKHRSSHSWPFYARMKPGVTIEQVQAELDTIAARLSAAHPATNTGKTFRALYVRDEATRDIRLQMQLMMGAVIAVLLIACGNVANLLLARSAGRSRELAVRAALGAGRGRLVRQVLTESLLLGLLGGSAGLLLAAWEYDLVLGLIPIEIPFWVRFEPDWRVFAFAAGATVGASVLFGLMPALHVSRPDMAGELKEGGRSGIGSVHGRRARSTLVVLQMALALVLLVVAGLTMRSFLNLQRIDTGIDVNNVFTFRTGLPQTMVKESHVATQFFEKVAQQLEATPGVESAGFLSYLPVSESKNISGVLIEGQPEPKAIHELPATMVRAATPGAFAALKVPLVAGRLFTTDDRDGKPLVAVVDEKFVAAHFPNRDPLGKRFSVDDPGYARRWFTIVGVVGPVRQEPENRREGPGVWLPLLQVPEHFASAVVRVRGDPAAFARRAEEAVHSVRSDVPIYYPKTMARVVEEELWEPRFFGGLFSGFAVIAVFLAAIGIYGVTAYSISQRTQEIGVRMALGAQPRTVIRMVVGEGAKLVGAGLAIGFVVAWSVAHLLSGALHGVEPHDPPTFASVPLLLGVVALAACYVPSRRATQIDPIIALRAE